MRRLAATYLERVEDLVERGRASRVRILEDSSTDRVGAPRLEEAHSFLGDTLRLLGEAEGSFSASEGETDATPWTVAADLAWLSQGEIRSRLESLKSCEGGPAWKVVSEADSALERAERALLALEGSLREALGLPPTERTRQRLRESLEVRRLYVALRRSILQAGDPEGESLETELWALSRQLDAFQSVETYGVVRMEDRRQFSALSQRIEAALADRSTEAESDRRSLWQDLGTFSRLLMTIHERDDLRSHDLVLVQEARRRLLEDNAACDGVLAELKTLLGRDDDLDDMLLDAAASNPETLAAILGRVEMELRQRTGGEVTSYELRVKSDRGWAAGPSPTRNS